MHNIQFELETIRQKYELAEARGLAAIKGGNAEGAFSIAIDAARSANSSLGTLLSELKREGRKGRRVVRR